MADANNGAAKDQGEESSNDGKPPVNDPAPSENKPDATETARREQQSQKDKAKDENGNLQEQVEFLSAKEAERARDNYVSELLVNKDKYPDVVATDDMFKYATSKEEVEEIADSLQNRFSDNQQNALQSVQDQPSTLTDEQIEEETTKLEKETMETGKSTFGSFMDTVSRRKR